MQQDSPQLPVEARADSRTKLLLSATMHSGDIARPVKIWDMSATGARVETLLAPGVGTAVTLVRGQLIADGRISWHAGRFCGMRFNSPVSTDEWMANPATLERRRANPRAAIEGEASDASAPSDAPAAARITEELWRVSRLLRTLREGLAGDPGVVLKHGIPLHNLGLAAEYLAVLADTMQADEPAASACTAGRGRGRS